MREERDIPKVQPLPKFQSPPKFIDKVSSALIRFIAGSWPKIFINSSGSDLVFHFIHGLHVHCFLL